MTTEALEPPKRPVKDDPDNEASPDVVMELDPLTTAADDDTSTDDNILDSTSAAIEAPRFEISNAEEKRVPVAPESILDLNKSEQDEAENGSVASNVVNTPGTKPEDAGQKQLDANANATEAPMSNEHNMLSDRSEEDIEQEIKGLIKEKDSLQCRESDDHWTAQDAERLQWVRDRMERLKAMLEPDLHQAKAAVKCFGHNQLPKSSTPVKKTKKTAGSKRKLEASANDSPVAKKPRAHQKLTKGEMRAKDFVLKSIFDQMNGETEESFNSDAMKNLEPISKAPLRLREHLKAIQAAGLRVPHAKPEIVKAHAKALGGLSQAFRKIVSPWVADGDGEKTVEDFKWQITGMRHPLHHHQLVAAANMGIIERDEEKDSITKFALRSGFLFDHMGYGKTLETLACIVSNPPKGKRSVNGTFTTLVVVPKSAADQWVNEVKNHCTDLTVERYHKDQDVSKHSQQDALSTDILIVTYDELRTAHKRVDQKKVSKSLLFQSKFHRICLDESHRIKSPGSETFKVCMKLKSKHKWCLTGTPIQNGVFEIYAPLKFIGHPLVKDFSDFKKKYLGGRGGKGLPTEGPRYSELSRITEAIMIVRSPSHSFLGCPLVSLPETHATMVGVDLSREEEVIQEYIDKHIKAHIDQKAAEQPTTGVRDTEEGDKADMPSEEMSLNSLKYVLLRKRQCVASPALLEGLVKAGIWTLQHVECMKKEVQKNGMAETPFIDMFEQWVKEPKSCKLSSGERKVLAKMQTAWCAQCLQPPTEPQVSGCGHYWCKRCVERSIRFSKFESPNENPQCPRCFKDIGAYHPCSPPLNTGSRMTKAGKPRLRGDDYNCFQPKDDSESTLMRIVDAHPSVPQSSKMKAILKQIQEWQQEAEDDKIIVFTNFIGVIRLLGRILQENSIEFLYFVGEMTAEQRQEAISTFKTAGEVKVLVSEHPSPPNPFLLAIPSLITFKIMSLQCGSESLNITEANRLILVDPWFNRSVESQAIARVYRIGQTKVTHAVRILAKDTIDDRIYEMQENKLSQMAGSLQEFHAERGLGARALRKLLGDRWKANGDDKHGSDDETDFDFVVRDDDSEDGDYEE